MGLIGCVWTGIFFVFNIMPDLHKESKQRQEMAERFAAKGYLQPVISVEDADDGRVTAVFKEPKNLKLSCVEEEEEESEIRKSYLSSSFRPRD